MSRRVISFDLSESGVDHAIKELERFQKDFMTACNELVKELGGLASETARSNIELLDAVFTAELLMSIGEGSRFDPQTRTAIVRTDCRYAAYVEFGTGIEGDKDSHPDAGAVGWNYASGKHSSKGAWMYLNDRDGRVHWTMGEPARPFMYNAYVVMRNEVKNFTATVFARL